MAKDRLLVIDDELGPRESLRFLFKDTYEVTCAESVDKGVVELRKNPPDAIIMDIKMPGKTGIQGLREIRALDPLVSIIMLTGFGSLETAQEAIRHGATDYLKKPFDTDEMRRVAGPSAVATARKRASAAASSALTAVTGQLAAGTLASLGEVLEFVHDLNNPLSVINGYVRCSSDIKDRKSLDQNSVSAISSRSRKRFPLPRDAESLARAVRRAESSIKKMFSASGRRTGRNARGPGRQEPR